jgi:hypothetical protein
MKTTTGSMFGKKKTPQSPTMQPTTAPTMRIPGPAKKPVSPKYENIRDPRTGQLKAGFALQAGPAVQLNTQAIDELRKQALAKESPWLAQQLEANQLAGQRQVDRAAKMAATGAAAGQAQLARRGGLSSGSAERMAMQAEENRALAQQEAFGQADLNRLNLMVGDAQSQRGLLQNIPGMELAQGQFGQAERAYNTGVNQFNLQNTLQEIQNKRGFDIKKYEEAMRDFAAERSAKAVERGR